MADQDPAQQAQVLQEFVQLTGVSEARCREYLEAADWDIGRAAQAFYLDTEDAATEGASSSAPADNYTGPRTLDGRPAPQAQRAPAAASSSRQAQPKRKGVATLGSLGSSSHQHDDEDDDDDDEEDEDGRNPRDLFAGGEKSGLAVQDPTQDRGGNARKLVRDIMSKAKENASRGGRDENEQPARSSGFRGSGQTLGGDGTESRVIPDPNAPAGGAAPANEEIQERVLHLWSDGFSIDGGELHRFDDPSNAADLEMIRNGRAPLHLMNVRYDQPVDVKLNQHTEAWHPIPQAYKPFSGSGRRLGSEVPGDSSTTAAAASAPAASSAAPAEPTNTIDDSQPTITIRIQLPDGTRLPARFNTTQTLETVYGFVQRASPATQSRSWVLATTFPNKEHTDRSLALGDIPEFKKGGTAVVKWA